MRKMKINWTVVFLGIMLTVCTQAQRFADDEVEPAGFKSAKSAISNVGSMMSQILTVVDLKSAVALSITNNCPNCELTDPKWYMMTGTNMNSPPPFTIKQGETSIIVFNAGIVSFNIKNLEFGIGTEGFLTFKFGNKWLLIAFSIQPPTVNEFLVQIRNEDPFTPGSGLEPSAAFKNFKTQFHKADKYGKWQKRENGGKKVIYSMGSANKAPFQIFVA